MSAAVMEPFASSNGGDGNEVMDRGPQPGSHSRGAKLYKSLYINVQSARQRVVPCSVGFYCFSPPLLSAADPCD